MKTHTTNTIIYVACVMFFHTCASAFEFAGGTGEPNDPYQIATAQQLLQINEDPNLADKSFVLINDIDLDPNGPEGQVFAKPPLDLEFNGMLDGQNYAIRNLSIHASERDKVGLFSQLSRSADVKRLILLAANVTGDMHVGALAGTNKGSLRDCVVSGMVTGSLVIGGLVGDTDGQVLGCSADVVVTGSSGVGGLTGGMSEGIVLNCQSTGHVLGKNMQVGGLIGHGSGFISDCSSNCTVEAHAHTGGLVGQAYDMVITYSWATGNVQGQADIGGLVGESRSDVTIVGCYAKGDVQGGFSVGGLVGGCHGGTIQNSYYQGQVQGHPYVRRDLPGELSHESQPKVIGGLVGGAWDLGLIHCYVACELNIITSEEPMPSDEPMFIGALVGQPNQGFLLGCLWNSELAGVEVCCGSDPFSSADETYGNITVDVSGKTTAEMQAVDTYVQAGWDFDSHWKMSGANDYPRLLWEKNEKMTGD